MNFKSHSNKNNGFAKYSKFLISFISLSFVINHLASAQDIETDQTAQDIFCSTLLNCSSCISRPQCAWCSQATTNPGVARCDYSENLLANECPDEFIINPASSVEILTDNVQIDDTQNPIQLHPQRIHLHIRKNDVQRFTIKYEQALNYPIDLYYLMDLTYSMKEHKEKLVELANYLAENMNNITKTFRLGFGSFIDKVAMPYANMVPAKLANPCTDQLQCAPPYGFKNHLPLNVNISQFAVEVQSTPLSGNLDNAEGGFDAIMQVMVCRDEIQWTNLSRKIILFATDSVFHYAGDGKLGGVVKPNDGLCHLNSEGYYTESLNQDYPSLEQIHKVVTESKVNVIFAVPEESIDVYKQLSEHLPGSTTALLRNDSSNIVELIRDNFKKIASRVEFRDNSSSAVQIKYMSSCLGRGKGETNICHNIGVGETVEFDVEIKVTECPPNGTEIFVITPIGISESTVVELHVMCECECETQPIAKPSSEMCSKAGTYACGVCICDQNRFGKKCECGGEDYNREELTNQCKRNRNSTQLCSNRGECVCGECQCHTRPDPTETVSGRFCECDNFSCARDINGHICGGPHRGLCCDGECHCMPEWTGPVCDCATSNATCIYDDQTKAVCSGRGECRCGSCRCNDGFYGQFCEDCASCEGRCNEIQTCVECKVFKSGTYSPVECRDKCLYDIDTFATLEKRDSVRQCVYFDSDDCAINFDYEYTYDNKLVVRVKEERECQPEVDTAIVVGSVALFTALIGLLLIVVARLIVWWKDKKEYEKFALEANKTRDAMNKSDTEMNPLFKPAQTKHMNPMFRKDN